MRVAIFTNNFAPRLSGVSVAVNFLNGALKTLGHETLVVAPDYGYSRKVKGVEVFRVKSVYLMPLRLSLPLTRLDETAIKDMLTQWKPDLIHSQHPFLIGKAALDMAEEFRVPLIYTFHTLYEFFTHYFLMDTEAVRNAVREYVVRYANQCDLVIAPTAPIKEYLTGIGVATRVEAVPTGLDFSRFKEVKEHEVSELREKFGLARFDKIMLSVGRISKEKNLGLCLSALSELVKRGKNYALILFGEGPEIGGLTKAAQELGIADRVIFGGFLDQKTLAAAYFLGHVFLFPSLSDTQGIVLYEARAAGLPLVATESMASRAIVHPGKNGLFAEDHPTDFADKIEQALAGRDRFPEVFDPEAFSPQTLGRTYDRLYRDCLARGRKTDPLAVSSLSRLIDDLRAMLS